eukprot:TRINITY_DN40539_c0_g1_i2.p1 TRINITY_DN40539_c0_g1~~TRINITY_DN40539_c0_g1_i2.p1  ORF type:complete len:606 (+),score=137.75 TRINITY_DN40539_c0_g1_i2:72-1820(+)
MLRAAAALLFLLVFAARWMAVVAESASDVLHSLRPRVTRGWHRVLPGQAGARAEADRRRLVLALADHYRTNSIRDWTDARTVLRALLCTRGFASEARSLFAAVGRAGLPPREPDWEGAMHLLICAVQAFRCVGAEGGVPAEARACLGVVAGVLQQWEVVRQPLLLGKTGNLAASAVFALRHWGNPPEVRALLSALTSALQHRRRQLRADTVVLLLNGLKERTPTAELLGLLGAVAPLLPASISARDVAHALYGMRRLDGPEARCVLGALGRAFAAGTEPIGGQLAGFAFHGLQTQQGAPEARAMVAALARSAVCGSEMEGLGVGMALLGLQNMQPSEEVSAGLAVLAEAAEGSAARGAPGWTGAQLADSLYGLSRAPWGPEKQRLFAAVSSCARQLQQRGEVLGAGELARAAHGLQRSAPAPEHAEVAGALADFAPSCLWDELTPQHLNMIVRGLRDHYYPGGPAEPVLMEAARAVSALPDFAIGADNVLLTTAQFVAARDSSPALLALLNAMLARATAGTPTPSHGGAPSTAPAFAPPGRAEQDFRHIRQKSATEPLFWSCGKEVPPAARALLRRKRTVRT